MTTRSPYSRLSHSGTAPDTTLASGVDASTLTVALIDGTGWPDGSAGSFVVIFEPGSSNEEKAVALSRSGNTLTLSQRGLEGAAVSHTASSAVRHGLSAVEVDEANYAVSQTVGQVAAKGDLLQGFGANQLRRVPGGSAGQAPVYQVDGSIAAGNPAPAAHTHAEADVTGLASDLSTLSSAVSTKLPAPSVPGTDGMALTADSTAPGGVSWKAAAVGQWTSYTPKITDASGVEIAYGNGTLTGRYVQVGKKVTVNVFWQSGNTTGNGSANISDAGRITLPVTPASNAYATGECQHFQVSGSNYVPKSAVLASGSPYVTLYALTGNGGTLTPGASQIAVQYMALTPGSSTYGSRYWTFTITYEAA